MYASDLVARVKLCNNGYIFVPTSDELACAAAHPDLFAVRGKSIHLAGKVNPLAPTDFFNTYVPAPQAPRALLTDVDWEGAILARQESMGFY